MIIDRDLSVVRAEVNARSVRGVGRECLLFHGARSSDGLNEAER